MKKSELQRLAKLENRIAQIAEEKGLQTTEIDFEVVPAQRVIEGMSYHFPMNFSHWTFGRDYERNRTVYDNTGSGIPYEQVWNFEHPKAFLVRTNPFALNVLILAHVFGHVDFYLSNALVSHGRSITDVSEEARIAAQKFSEYERRHGKDSVEKVIDAAMSIRWHEHPNPFFEEQDEEVVRQRLLAQERAKLERAHDIKSEFTRRKTKEEIRERNKSLQEIQKKTPPVPVYDLLHYIMNHSPKPLKPWMVDVLRVIRNQSRSLSPNARTKMLNEGWATYCHVHIMRQLFQEGLLTAEEHDTFNYYHAKVLRPKRIGFNWYRVGYFLYEDVKERWDKGQFGREYEECKDPKKRSKWDTQVNQGREKIFEVRESFSDRMAVEQLFSNDFIHEQKLYLYGSREDPRTGDIIYYIQENNPEVIRNLLKSQFSSPMGAPLITVENGNVGNASKLFLKHHFTGYELDPEHLDGVLRHIYYLWGKKVYLKTQVDEESRLFVYDGVETKKTS